jgi:hypothetical protein
MTVIDELEVMTKEAAAVHSHLATPGLKTCGALLKLNLYPLYRQIYFRL